MKNAGMQKVLIVDDSVSGIMAYKDILAKEGIEVQGCYNGEDLEEIIDKNKPDLVLLDVYMEGKTGFDVLRQLKRDGYLDNVRVVMFSGSVDADDMMESIRLGALGYIRKLPNIKKMVNNINHYLNARFDNRHLSAC